MLYISRDPSASTPHIHTKILDITINSDRIKLRQKSEADLKRVFVTDTAAVGAEATGPNQAAVGAVGSTCAASASASATSATLGEADSPGEAAADTDKFLRNEVVGWMSSLEAVGSSLPEAVDAALAALGKTPEDMVQA